MKMLVHSVALLGAFAATALVASDSRAGQQVGGSWSCESGGFCVGTMVGARTNADSTAYGSFWADGSSGGWYFYGESYGSGYSCFLPANSNLIPMTTAVLSARGYVSVDWNSSGYCTDVFLGNSSQYAQSW